MKLKLIPISGEAKATLESEVGYIVCPLTTQDIRMLEFVSSYGIPAQFSGEKKFFLCAADGGEARGGVSVPSISLPGYVNGKTSPCSYEYAKKCHLSKTKDYDDFSNCLGE